MQQNTLITKPLLKSLGVVDMDFGRNHAYLQMFTLYVTDKQIETLTKAAKFGWKANKIVWNTTAGKVAISLYANECVAWVHPDGTLDRAKVGVKTAYLSNDWTQD
jgi:hypothetical protein